jgi:predicted dehydrogenase
MSKTNASAVGAAVIGTGFIGSVHIETLRRLGVNLRGVLTRDAPAATNSGRFPKVYTDLEQLCGDDGVDVVHVTSPNSLHCDQVLALTGANKHVVCEKPLATSVEQGCRMLQASEASGAVGAVCFNIRFNPLVYQARSMVSAGAIGAPRLATGSYLQDWLLRSSDWNWRLDPTVVGPLQATADIGSHWLDMVSFVMNARVDEVFADLYTVVPVRYRPRARSQTFGAVPAERTESDAVPVNSDDAASVLVHFDNGARGAMTVSQVSPGRKNACSFEIAGSEASLAWSSEDPERLWIGHRERSNETMLRDPSLLAGEARAVTHYPGGHTEGFAESFLGLFESVYAVVLADERPAQMPFPTFRDGLEGLFVEEAIVRSSTTRRWEPIRRRAL